MSSEEATLLQEEEHQVQAQVLSLAQEKPDSPVVAGYELNRLLGRGSFGEVWSGVQLRSGQAVAVKVITAATSMNWQYLEHEVSRLRQVAEHPHVVTLLDADFRHSPPFFVMTLHSRTLQGWVALDQSDGVERVAEWLRQMAEALQYTHARGLLHCDLKPSNVLLDEEGRARLSDFGQSVGRGQPQRSLGSLGYMGPEQVAENSLPDISWDIYGLGATVYHLLTGETPRLDEECRQQLATLTDSTAKLQRYQSLLHSRKLIPIRELNSRVDVELAHLVESCLSLDPTLRTSHVGQVLEDLERRQAGLPLLCRRPWPWTYRLEKILGRHRQAAWVALLALLGLTALGYSKWHSDQASRTLLARQEWEQGWTLQRQGREPEALLWWARGGARDQNHALVLSHASTPLVAYDRWGEAPTHLRFASDGQLLIACESEIRLGERGWKSEVAHQCKDLGPYRIARSSVGLLDNQQVIGTSQGRLKQLTEPEKDLGPSRGPVVVGGNLAVYEDGSQLLLYSADSGQSLPLTPWEGSFEVAAVNSHWVVCAQGQRLRVWEAGSGRPLPLEWGQSSEISSLSLSPDGARLAVAGADGRVVLWELPSGKKLGECAGRMRMVACQFSPDGSLLATCNYDGTVELRRGQDLSPSGLAPMKHRWMVYGCVFSASGRWLATHSIDGTARVWDTSSGRPGTPFLEHLSPVRLAAFSPEEDRLATTTLDGSLRIFSLRPHHQQLIPLQLEGARATSGDLSPDGKLAAVALGQEVHLWNVSQNRRIKVLPGSGLVAFSRQGSVLAVAGRELRLWRTENWEPVGSALPLESEASALRWSPDGGWVALGTDNGSLRLFDAQNPAATDSLERHSCKVTSIDFSRDGRFWVSSSAVGGSEGEAHLREFPSGRRLHTLRHPTQGIPRALFHPDSSRLLTCGEDARGRWWDPASGTALKLPELQHSLGIWDAAWSQDGSKLVTASGDSTLQVWDSAGRPLTPMLQHDGPVVRVQLSRDGTRLASSSKDGTARLWDANTGQALLAPVQHGDMVFVCRLSADGQSWLTASDNGRVHLVDLSDEHLPPLYYRLRVERWSGLRLTVTDGIPRLGALTPREWSALPQR